MNYIERSKKEQLEEMRNDNEYIVRIVKCNHGAAISEFVFSDYREAIRFAYEKEYKLTEEIKRIEILDAFSYRLPLIVIERSMQKQSKTTG